MHEPEQMHHPRASDAASLAGGPDAYAGWWQRLAGMLLDACILLLTVLVGWLMLAVLAWFADPQLVGELTRPGERQPLSDAAQDSLAGWGAIGLLATSLLVIVWDIAWVRSRHMARPGQRLLGYRVVEADGWGRVGLGRAVGRSVAKWFYGVPSIGMVLAIVTALMLGLNRRRQATHDVMSGTVCVRTSELERRGLLQPRDAAREQPTGGPFL